jgi:DNA-binding SARP family transcriptional activator
MLRVQLFGSGRIFDDAVEVRLRSREWTLPLLAYLLMHRGEVIPRRRLAFLMWPDESEEDALTKLRQNLHRLSRVLPEAPAGTPWVSGGSHTISWNCSTPFAIDVAEYERLRTETATLEQAVEHYTGDFLAELDEDWIAIERERLRRLYHADLGTLIRKHRSRRSFDRAIHYAGLLLVSDPWHEEALRALLSARYESGDASGALAEFDAFARRLRAEMDAEPMPETLALREAIARGAPISTTLDSAENAAGHYSHTLPFIGRTEDLASLHGRWSRAARGLGGLTFVRGEAGIGKSRIVSELALLAEAEGGRVLLGRTSSPERDPYQCFSSAVRGALPLVAGVALAPPFLAALAELVPELHAYREDIPQPVRLDPQSERARLLDAGAQLLIELARPRPLLLILEDVHRAGVATIDAIAGIVPRISRSPVLVIATCRPEAVDRVRTLRRLLTDAQSSAELLELGPMNADEVRLLVDASGVAERVSSEFVSSLHRRSGGNPLFVTELMRDAERAESGGSAIAIPETVSAMITERVATLAPSSITVADVAAVAGEAFSVELIREVAQLPNRELLDGIDELLDRHLIRETTGRARYDYAFTHHLVHAAIYENVPPDARSRRHRRIARILEAESSAAAGDNDERAREIALHFERGQDASRAAHHYAHAARRAAALYANEEARELVDRALELGAREDRERFDLLLLRSKLSARLGDIAGDDSDVRALEEIARRLDADAIGTALWQRIDLASRRANRDEECEAIERLREHATAIGSDYWLASVDEAQANRAFSDGEFAVAIECALRADRRRRRNRTRRGVRGTCERQHLHERRRCGVFRFRGRAACRTRGRCGSAHLRIVPRGAGGVQYLVRLRS